MGGFTHEEIEGAKLARQTQGRVGNPPNRVLKKLIGTDILKKKPVTIENVADAFSIFGSNVNILKGAATRQRPHRVMGGICEIPTDFIGSLD